jgi:hypothetical protein
MPPVELPLRCFEASTMIATYWASSVELQTHTPPELRVVEVLPGKSIVGLACIDYKATTVGPYGEVGIAWPVVKAESSSLLARIPLVPLLGSTMVPDMGWWVHALPVTTQEAMDAGTQVWGFPKFLATIEFGWNGPKRVCSLSENGTPILELVTDTRLAGVPQRLAQKTYTRLSSHLVTTQLDIEGVGFGRVLLTKTELSLGTHRLGQQLRQFGVKEGRAAMAQWFPVWRTRLPGPTPA